VKDEQEMQQEKERANSLRQARLKVKLPLVKFVDHRQEFNPLSPNSDENEISLYIITSCSNIQVMGVKEVITKDEVS